MKQIANYLSQEVDLTEKEKKKKKNISELKNKKTKTGEGEQLSRRKPYLLERATTYN